MSSSDSLLSERPIHARIERKKDGSDMEEKVNAIIDILKQRYPDALCALHYDSS